ncbi:MAG TPA: ABC transporter substrate-binding protein [Acidimicrobiales bacterium]|nr:ABC transporter substrate-binding protein [Acidimicrobiales bacterium]
MKIVSLLPSATEICFALGLEEQLEAVTFECDFPDRAKNKPHATGNAIPQVDDPGEIDRLVRASLDSGEPIYTLDDELIRTIDPDLVLAQDLCRVCAVPSGHVEAALDRIGRRARVVSLDPSSLDDVIDCVQEVADAAGVADRGREVVTDLRARLSRVRNATAALPRVKTLSLEWSDPAFVGGHWVPEMVEAAGGIDVLGAPRHKSRTVDWSEIADAAAEVVVFMPCGYDLAAAVAEGKTLLDRSELGAARSVYAVDATAYFSRPGPRVVDGVELLAWALHPDDFPAPPAGRVTRLR